MNKTLLVIIVSIILVSGYLIFFKPKTNDSPTSQDSAQQQFETVETTNYKPFTKSEYDTALASNKVVLLSFYANWCPICRAEDPDLIAGFKEFEEKNLIGFRVNFNDTDTDEFEKKLAKDFRVPYQHTKIFLKNGQEVARFTDQWTKEDFIKEVGSILSQ
ncbi:MAG: hypothetical protein COU27_03190 [Candidatus Levybacteria bacterium CG10_big_fil_rev_8_21_14_0_10_36_7]|nr:MAG: hypothetical protein COU27_03190 [Candidatus Levybacteria bacterium CG10_big_fil_rev_8_21_14_0_10_36_7]